jgi:hypothetical protein
MSRFVLPVSCIYCAGRLELVNAATQGLLSIAVVECPGCDRQFELTIRLAPHRSPERETARERKVAARARAHTSDTAYA